MGLEGGPARLTTFVVLAASGSLVEARWPWRFAKASPAADQTFSMTASARFMFIAMTTNLRWRALRASPR